MPRSVNHVASRARRKKIIKLAKGFYGRGKNVWTVAKNKIENGLQYAYRDRKVKKRDFRSLWISVSTLPHVRKECLTQYLWVRFMQKVLS